MKPMEVKPGIYWVGAIDWDLRNFHGYSTPRGSTYNAYLILDEQVVLVDTVKHYLADEMLSRKGGGGPQPYLLYHLKPRRNGPLWEHIQSIGARPEGDGDNLISDVML